MSSLEEAKQRLRSANAAALRQKEAAPGVTVVVPPPKPTVWVHTFERDPMTDLITQVISRPAP